MNDDVELVLAKRLHAIVHPQHSWETADKWNRDQARHYARWVNEGLSDAGLAIVAQNKEG